ncbi:hypothetical protein BWI97_07170 [Siphonobacter sp. BAB-5405]|uniref:hypothetical protein n=1 Tax=Siphonobacter sp. BAB-5405 TaxID=1864825 RepID=UPI000C7FD54A|nr:hypothetical protein [Siphonobacter sp. BAB-5405]PMD97403.1 hypothetical protein BWI97_07170 [Siphonobacter sp. BAB-5405]
MVELRINGQVIDLAPSAGASFEKVNPYFTYEDIYTDQVQVPSIPLSQRNRRILGFLDLPRLGSNLPRFFLQKFYNGQLIHEGLALVTDVTAFAIQMTAVQPIGEFFGDYQFQKLSEIDLGTVPRPGVITPVLLDTGQPAYCFPTIVNPDYYGTNGGSVGYSGRVNHYGSGSYQAGPLVPMPFLSYVLKKIAALTGTTLKGTFFQHPVWSQLVLYNTRALDSQQQITLTRHLPGEMTLIQLLIELRKLLNLSFTFDTVNKVLEIDATDDILSTPATLDWSDKLVKGGRKIIERNRRLQLSMSLDSGDQLQKDKPEQLADYLTPEFAPDLSIAKLTTSFSTLLIDQESGLASTKQVGSTELFSQLASTWSPRLLLWNGLQSGLPRALPTLAGKSLFWNGVGGVFETCWQRTEKFRRGLSYLDAQMILDETDIATLNFKKSIHVNGCNYFIVRVSGNLPLTSTVSTLLVLEN